MVSLVTGGASGLGKATVQRLIQDGGKVVILDVQGQRAKDFAQSIGKNVAVVVGCIKSEKDVNSALDTANKQFGRLDNVVNCAGIVITSQVYNFNRDMSGSLEYFQNVIDTNIVGTINVIRLAAGMLGKNKPNADGQTGVIINTSSGVAYDGDKGQTHYAAASAGIIGMTLPIARDLASRGIRVVTIAPGVFQGPLINHMPTKVLDYIKRQIPFPSRLGRPEEFAQLVTNVIENPMLNGNVIRLDGAYRCFPL